MLTFILRIVVSTYIISLLIAINRNILDNNVELKLINNNVYNYINKEN